MSVPFTGTLFDLDGAGEGRDAGGGAGGAGEEEKGKENAGRRRMKTSRRGLHRALKWSTP